MGKEKKREKKKGRRDNGIFGPIKKRRIEKERKKKNVIIMGSCSLGRTEERLHRNLNPPLSTYGFSLSSDS